MQHIFTIDGEQRQAWLARTAEGYRLLHQGGSHAVSLAQTGDAATLTWDGEAIPLVLAVAGDRVWLHIDGTAHEVVLHDPVALLGAADGQAASGTILAPMPGVVIAVEAQPGDRVSAGDTLLVIESMKLETAIKAPRDGTLASMGFAAGQSFERDAVLATLESED